MRTATRATAYWTVGPHRAELRTEELRSPEEGECLVRALVSGISAGTERLVHTGDVPVAVAASMHAPFQAGEFPFPVKYGYLTVGEVEEGPPDLAGRRVFVLYPHQDRLVVPAASVVAIPEEVPSERALLAAAVETALNGLWDGAPLVGDRVAVVGAGLIGTAVAALLSRLWLRRLVVVDPSPERRALVERLGVTTASELEGEASYDIVFHCSATEEGLNAGLEALDFEGTLVELSWYGDRAPQVQLGSAFHARRLRLVSSQVGAVSPGRRARCTLHQRLELAMEILRDPSFDLLVGHEFAFDELPRVMEMLAAREDLGLCPVIRYP